MDKQAAYELQLIDCSCNDCKYMFRDFATYMYWEEWHRRSQRMDFDRKKAEALRLANECTDPKGKQTLTNLANKMRFQFDKSGLLNYGLCEKFEKQVTFIPSICQIETQQCFEHRKPPTHEADTDQ